MDPHILWVRRRLARAVTAIALIWLMVATAGALIALLALTQMQAVAVLSLGVILGQLILVASLARAAFGNPLSLSYLLAQDETPCRYEPSADNPDQGLVNLLARARLSHLTALRRAEDSEVVFDLFQSAQSIVTLARNRQTELTALFSRLSDGRILVTDSLIVVPHSGLVVNPSGSPDLRTLMEAHRHGLALCAEQGISAVADGGHVFFEALALEHDALLAIGPVLGPFLSLEAKGKPTRFLVALGFDEVRALSLPRRHQMLSSDRLQTVA